jgi:1-acyl-sn-glycerol-3-phosphate acyltransferase
VVIVDNLWPRPGAGVWLARRLVRPIFRALGIRLDVHGRQNLPADQAYVVVANHRSMIDAMVLLMVIPNPRVVTTKVVFDYPLMRLFCRATGAIAVDQSNPLVAMRDLRRMAGEGLSSPVIVFPEGHRGRSPELLPFEMGAYVMAFKAAVPIVPIAIHNSATVLHADGGYRTTHPGRIVVEILDPIATAGLTSDDRRAVRDRSHSAIRRVLRPCDGGNADGVNLAQSATAGPQA